MEEFLRTGNMRVSQWAAMAHAFGMGVGEHPLINVDTGLFQQCDKHREARMPLFAEDE